jgi:predicted dehydrogenase
MKMNDHALRTAVVGMGKMGLLHTSVLSVVPNVEVVGVCEKSSIIRKLLKKTLRTIPVVDDVRDLSGLDLDAVFVTTPVSSHFSVAKIIYQEDLARNIFIEKPLCSSVLESRELCDLNAKVRGVGMVGYLRRFMVTFAKAKKLLLDDAVGDLISFRIGAFSSDFVGIANNPKGSIGRGGVLRDLGSYSLDLALWFFGDFRVVSSSIESITGKNAQDSVHAVVEREFGSVRGDLSVSWCAPGFRMAEVDVEVKGTKGILEVNDDKVRLDLGSNEVTTWHRVDLNDLAPFWIGAPEYYREDECFVKSVFGNLVAEPSFESALRVDSKIELIEKEAAKY